MDTIKLTNKQKKYIKEHPVHYRGELIQEIKQERYNNLFERTSTLIREQVADYHAKNTGIVYKIRQKRINRNQDKLFKMSKELKEK